MVKLEDLKFNSDICEALAWPFNFDLARADQDTSWIRLDPSSNFICIAGEGSGGVYLSYGEGEVESRPILFASSEGQAGKIANNLDELLAILVSAPYWFDLLKFSGNGVLEEMIKTESYMIREYEEDYPDLDESKKLITSKLCISPMANAVEVLHGNIHATDCTLVAEDGWKYETLFNSFVSSDNKSWAKT